MSVLEAPLILTPEDVFQFGIEVTRRCFGPIVLLLAEETDNEQLLVLNNQLRFLSAIYGDSFLSERIMVLVMNMTADEAPTDDTIKSQDCDSPTENLNTGLILVQ